MGDDQSRPGPLVAGRYRLTEQIGSGGMGVVWRAQDEQTGGAVALKPVRLDPTAGDAERVRTLALLRRQADVAAAVSAHPNVATGRHRPFTQTSGRSAYELLVADVTRAEPLPDPCAAAEPVVAAAAARLPRGMTRGTPPGRVRQGWGGTERDEELRQWPTTPT